MVMCDTAVLARIFSWINWGQLIVLGGYNMYVQFDGESFGQNSSNELLACYIFLFGIVGALCEAEFGIVHRNLKFLHTPVGKAVFFIFVGTLALAFVDNSNSSQTSTSMGIWNHQAVPLLMGCFSIVAAGFSLLDMCASKSTPEDGSYKAAEAKAPI